MEQRGTSLAHLANANASSDEGTLAQPVQTSMHNNAPSDNELVDDILNEINQNQNDTTGGAAFEQQMDTQTQHNIAPATEQDVQDYQQAEMETAVVQTNGEVSEGERLLREQSAAAVVEKPTSFFGSFDILQFAKTLLLTMILFIVVTNAHTQSVVCKIPQLCSTVNGVMQLNFMGTGILALLCGIVLAVAQALL